VDASTDGDRSGERPVPHAGAAQIRSIAATRVTRRDGQELIDITLGVATSAARAPRAVGRGMRAVAGPLVGAVAGIALRPPLVIESYQPVTWLRWLAQQGEDQRSAWQQEASDLLDVVVPAVAAALLQRLNVTDIVRRHVDFDELIETVDLAGLTETVIAEVDLPEILRQSTGSMASETVRGVRMQGISGDEAIGRAMGRFHRRRGQKASPPVSPESEAPMPGGITPGPVESTQRP
jgi:hypothetical protein